MADAIAVKKERFEALDVLRGLTIMIMALDHARDFFALGFVLSAPTNLDVTNMEVFLTRWITHFAAPTFIFLAGIGLFFASSRRSKFELATLAFTRGIWLIFLELTLVGFFWSFSSDFIYQPKIGVLFVIGVCMIAMAGMIYFPKWLIAFIAVVMILGHNFFDGVHVESFGGFAWLWQILHVNSSIYMGSIELRVVYPFIPWVGVIALGYLFGPTTKLPRVQRKQIFLFWGFALLAVGLVLRYWNIYGDGSEWTLQETLELSIISFLNFTKYPASLIYLSLFLGIAMILMSLLDRELGKWSHPFRNVGQVPFFFYILHIPILHIGGIALALLTFGDADWLFKAILGPTPEEYSYGYELLPTYLAWIGVIILLYFPSRWFADLKARRKDWWLSYL